jgi:methyl-accepting chemotaxis protein
MNLKNQKLGTKLAFAFGIQFLLVLTIAYLNFGVINSTLKVMKTQNEALVPNTGYASSIQNNATKLFGQTLQYLLTGEKKDLDEIQSTIDKSFQVMGQVGEMLKSFPDLAIKFKEEAQGAVQNLQAYQNLLKELEKLKNNETKQIATLNASFSDAINNVNTTSYIKALSTGHNKIITAYAQNNLSMLKQEVSRLSTSLDNEKSNFLLNNYLKTLDNVLISMSQLDALKKKCMITSDNLAAITQTVSTKNNDFLSTSIGGVTTKMNSELINAIIIIVLSLIISFLLAFTITKIIAKGLNKAIEFVEEIAAGDLSLQSDEYKGRKDEAGRLANALNNMSKKLNEIISEIRDGVNHITSASMQLSSTSQELSQGASEQASSAEEISTTMEQTASSIQHNSKNANETSHIAEKVEVDITEGSKVVKETVSSMKSIAEKITFIREIARQTNILALNAAVEAARAGEHGKGFAVVADEVRNLAARSQESANEIEEISKFSVEVAEKSGHILENLVPEINKNASLIKEISAASDEQASGASQVNNAIQQLNTITQQNAAAAEEMATSSEELSSQADAILNALSFFKTRSTNGHNKKDIDYRATTTKNIQKESGNVKPTQQSETVAGEIKF